MTSLYVPKPRITAEELSTMLVVSLAEAIARLPSALRSGDLKSIAEVGNAILGLEKVIDSSINRYVLSNSRQSMLKKLIFGVPENPEKKSWIWLDMMFLQKSAMMAERLAGKLDVLIARILFNIDLEFPEQSMVDVLSCDEMCVVFMAVKIADTLANGYSKNTIRIWCSPSVVKEEKYFFVD